MRSLAVGKVAEPRGGGGELTIRVVSGDAARWECLKFIEVATEEGAPLQATYRVERARSYRDRLVLKLEGVDGAASAAALRGLWVFAPASEVPSLPDGVYWVARLVGMRVVDETRGEIGTVRDVEATGGVDILVVGGTAGGEILIPLARAFIREIGEDERVIRVDVPEELMDPTRAEDEA